MNSVRPSNPRLRALSPYDAKNYPAEVFLSANENPSDIPHAIKEGILARLETLAFNRYPDPLATSLRSLIAETHELSPENVLVGNGGDEMLFNIFLAWGGSERKFLNTSPTFSVYAYNAYLTGTKTVEIARLDDYSIDEQAVLDRVGQGDIDFVIVTNPNNPTGNIVSEEFLVKLLDATDALILVDEAYGEFSGETMAPYLGTHKNLLILHTFSKAYSLAGVRCGYILGDEDVIGEFLKVRQPYSVDAVSQVIAEEIVKNRDVFTQDTKAIVARREGLYQDLCALPGVTAFPSYANYIMFRVEDAHAVWEELYESYSVLIRDFSSAPGLEDCLRVSVGSEQENERFLAALGSILERR
ncbi:MAG: histidinol-phosphate transaminase [Actinobacteria bacterium]|nr:histidinol-phosphate transaminase [Actinomycetota bacterium]